MEGKEKWEITIYDENDDEVDFERANGHGKSNHRNGTSGNPKRPKPFEVRAPPGMLGMVIDTPNGGVPVVRAIKPDSVLTDRVVIGDRLISVDHQDVTSMSALEVSNLISVKSNRQRLKLCVVMGVVPAVPVDFMELWTHTWL